MARRGEHSQDEIKAMVLKAAETIVAEKGYAELKVRNIAMEIGYTVGSIYMVFDNLADLIIHLKARTLDDLAAHLQQVSTDSSAHQCLLNLAFAYLRFANQHFNRWQMVFGQRSCTEAQFPDWYQIKFEQLFAPIEKQFRGLAIDASDKELRLAAQALLGGVHGISSLLIPLHQDRDNLNELETTVSLLVENFVQGWLINRTQLIRQQHNR